MGDQVQPGSGNVYQGNPEGQTGTYSSNGTGGSLTYDDNPPGSSPGDKSWTWDPSHGGYYRPTSASWSTANAHAFFTAQAQRPDHGKEYKWDEYDRGGDSGDFPTQPTGHGRTEQTS